MLAAIITALGESIASFISVLAAGVTAAGSIFWDSTANTGAGALTTIGTICVVALALTLGTSILYKVFDLVTGFFHMHGN